MSHLYYIMGKSSSGKDTIFRMLMEQYGSRLNSFVPYTTRPIREGEMEGREYHYIDYDGMKRLESEGRIIECRCYNTVHGDWYYFTVGEENIDFTNHDYVMIGTLESYEKTVEFYGKEIVYPIYVEVEDGIRLRRALDREDMQKEPKYKELCRRFLADSEDFSESKLAKAGIKKRFINDNLDRCYKEIADIIIG